MKINGEPMSFSKYGKSFQEKLCMVILDDRAFADQIEEVLDVNFLELNWQVCRELAVAHYTRPSYGRGVYSALW